MNDIVFVHDNQASPGPRKVALERAGWSVRATPNATEALVWLRESPAALVLLDVLVEGGPGFDVCRRIRDHHAQDELPIVLGCSIYQEPEHAAEAEHAGAQAYLRNPVDLEDLVALVTRLTGERRGVRAA